ncbi:hypothetical protein PENTCL1PPCAC_7381, partial [Pristionchus entomophagus]
LEWSLALTTLSGRILEMFPKGRPRFTMQQQLQQLQLNSTTFYLPTRRTHLTVEIYSPSEQQTALYVSM